MPEDKVESVNGMTLTADGKGAVFDVHAADVDAFLAGNSSQLIVNKGFLNPSTFFFNPFINPFQI